MRIAKLRQGIPVITRGNDQVQFGADPKHGLVISNLKPTEVEYLLYLSNRPSQSKLARYQERLNISDWKVHQLHKRMLAGGILEEHSSQGTHAYGAEKILCARLDGSMDGYKHRAESQILIVGADRLGTLIAALLNSAGIGNTTLKVGMEDKQISSEDLFPFTQDSIGKDRISAASKTLEAFNASTNPMGNSYYDLSIIITYGSFSPVPVRMMGLSHIPHLAICLGDMSANVGPLVQPGISACTHCLDLHRADQDPEWPNVKQQLLTWGMKTTPGTADAASLAMIAGTAVRYATDYLDHRGIYPLGAFTTLPYYPADPVSKKIEPHPRCSCILN